MLSVSFLSLCIPYLLLLLFLYLFLNLFYPSFFHLCSSFLLLFCKFLADCLMLLSCSEKVRVVTSAETKIFNQIFFFLLEGSTLFFCLQLAKSTEHFNHILESSWPVSPVPTLKCNSSLGALLFVSFFFFFS